MGALGFLIFLSFLVVQGCATPPPPRAQSPLVPLPKANLEAALEEQEGLEIEWEDAKDARDFYRGGVQQKARAEKKYREKSYSEALEIYDKSQEFFFVALKYVPYDSSAYTLFEGTQILFFPNLLIADNYLKIGKILKAMGRDSSARRQWKKALPYIQQSLRCEYTEWGLATERELKSLLEFSER
jgi:tetratricopeptide (TPR) repeat protein